MPTIEANGRDLLAVVKAMEPEEFDAFIEKALSARPRTSTATLSKDETRLIKRINRGLPSDLVDRCAFLVGRRRKGNLTADERQELLHLTHHAETQDADRAAALLELAKLRRVPVRVLMMQMGIKTPAIHG